MSVPLIVLASLQAHALAPSDEVLQGIEPGRVFVSHPEEQGRLLQGRAWRTFAATDGQGWTARFDELTGRPRWAWGRGIALPAAREELVAELSSLLTRHAGLFGFEGGTLRLRTTEHDARRDTWYVEFDTPREGLTTWLGGISARVAHGRLVLLVVRTAPGAPVTGSHALGKSAAVQAAIGLGPAPHGVHTEVVAEEVLLERSSPLGLQLRRVWKVTSRTRQPPGAWVSFVDGESGELLSVHNEVRFATGTVTGLTHQRTVDGTPLVSSPMPLSVVRSSTESATADGQGSFTVAGPGPYWTDLDGDYARVLNQAGPEGRLSANDAGALEWTTGDARQSEIDTYKFLHDVHAWGERYAPEVAWVSGPITAEVNLSSECNAYWDGAVHFYDAGGGCNNSGEIADVIYHEWGHGFHYYSLLGGVFDGAVSEGAGDVVSTLLTHDGRVAPWFFTDGGAIRDLEPDRAYPDDLVGEVHEDGLIFGGAMYDLLGLLEDELGEADGIAATSDLFAGLLKGGPTLPDTFHEALVADDDDGDLQNGTPHACQIDEAFGRHDLDSRGGLSEAVMISHEPLVVEAAVAHPVRAELVDVSAGCRPAEADAGEVRWRTSGGGWQTAPLWPSAGGVVTGEIPSVGEGAIVEYYLTGSTVDGDTFTVPSGGELEPFTFYEGELLDVRCDDFEQDDAGYTHLPVGGTPGVDADDWEWGTAYGRSGDPSGAFSGSRVWGNDLGHVGYNGAYGANQRARLSSPVVDTAWYTGVLLRYRRWLTVEDGLYDQALITANGVEVWRNRATPQGDDATIDGSWRSHVVDLGGLADRGQVTLDWGLTSDAGLELGGWTLDDVCLVAPATADNRLGIGDLRVEVTGDTTALLTWTHPVHGPLERVRVVRSIDGLPSGAEDGEVVAELEAPSLGEAMVLEDTSDHAGVTWYAVYGFDGDRWLSWTIDGFNAASVSLVGDTPLTVVEGTEDSGSVPAAPDVEGVHDLVGPATGGGCDETGSRPGVGVGAVMAALVLVVGRRWGRSPSAQTDPRGLRGSSPR